MRRILICTLLLLSACATFGVEEETPNTLLFLVRHAERTDDAPGAPHEQDPHLSAAGFERSSLLAELLRDVGLTHIHSTDFQRTRETAEATAEATGVDLSIYDPEDLAGFAHRIRSEEGRHLVVGHSNTTWDLVEALGGEPGPPIEPLEYDRLYLLTIEDGKVSTILLRFGNRFTH